MTGTRWRVAATAAGLVAVVALAVALSSGGGQDKAALQIAPPDPGPSSWSTSPTPSEADATAPPPRPSPSPQGSASAEASNVAQPELGVAGRVVGVVSDEQGRPLDGIRIMSGDLDQVLGRTGRDGSFSVACDHRGLVYAPYAFPPQGRRAETREAEPSPGRGNYAFRVRPADDCGHRVAVTLPPGGVVAGKADRRGGTTVWLSRVVDGKDADGDARFGAFVTPAHSDGTYRIEGLATGRYSIDTSYEGFADEATFVDVHEGRTTDGSYSYYIDPAVCVEPDGDGFTSNGYCESPAPQWPDEPSPTPSPGPTATPDPSGTS